MNFTIKHTASDVEYLANDFIDKNKEEFSSILNTIMTEN